MRNKKYLFTFDGSPAYPFKDGYVLVWAKTWEQAIARYRGCYPVAKPIKNGGLTDNIRCAHMICEADLKGMGPCNRILGNPEE